MGMIGGGQGAFIGAVHRMAAALDGHIELVCGAFSSNAETSKATGRDLYLPESRVYGNYHDMFEKEKALPAGERMDFVTIVTPNHLHFKPAMMALEMGFHVVIDKPITFSLEEARTLKSKVAQTGLLLCLTHTYTGYPMVKQAREMIKAEVLGNVRKVVVEYPQGWLTAPIEQEGQKQAGWRTDPARSGKTGAMGDIGTHAENLAEYITGLHITEVCADLNTIVPGRQLDDNGTVLLRFNNGAKGLLYASQIAAGEENELKIRVYGERGGLEWQHSDPNSLIIKWLDLPKEVYRSGSNYPFLANEALHNSRLPAGHPEGYLEAFANLYRNFALALSKVIQGQQPDPITLDFPGVNEGIRGMAFIDAIVESAASNQKWIKITE